MRINYDNIPEIMTNLHFWDMVREILFGDTNVVAHGIMAKLNSESVSKIEGMMIRLRSALIFILVAAVNGVRLGDQTMTQPLIMDYEELSNLYTKEFEYLIHLLKLGIGLTEIEKKWGTWIEEIANHKEKK